MPRRRTAAAAASSSLCPGPGGDADEVISALDNHRSLCPLIFALSGAKITSCLQIADSRGTHRVLAPHRQLPARPPTPRPRPRPDRRNRTHRHPAALPPTDHLDLCHRGRPPVHGRSPDLPRDRRTLTTHAGQDLATTLHAGRFPPAHSLSNTQSGLTKAGRLVEPVGTPHRGGVARRGGSRTYSKPRPAWRGPLSG